MFIFAFIVSLAGAAEFEAEPKSTVCVDPSAHGHEEMGHHEHASPVRRSLGRDMHVHGMVGMEARVIGKGHDINSVEIMTAQIAESVLAPLNTRRDGRQLKWRKDFGRTSLVVKRERLGDGSVVFEQSALEAPRPWWTDEMGKDGDRRLCVEVPHVDPGTTELDTWNDAARTQLSEHEYDKRAGSTTLVMVDDQSAATMAHLAPGESMTVVEIEVPAGRRSERQAKRQVTLNQSGYTMVVQQRGGKQTICVAF